MLRRAKHAPIRALPLSFIEPCIASEREAIPQGPGWVHEIKHDGYRMQLRKDGDRVRLFTRRGFDWTDRYPLVIEAARRMKAETASIDGEIVVAGKNGISDFELLHSRRHDDAAFLYAFDLMECDGKNLRPRSLVQRKEMLADLIKTAPIGLQFNEHDRDGGETLFRAACRLGFEGIVSKRIDRPYRTGPKRSLSWVKVRNKKAPGYLRVRDGLDG